MQSFFSSCGRYGYSTVTNGRSENMKVKGDGVPRLIVHNFDCIRGVRDTISRDKVLSDKEFTQSKEREIVANPALVRLAIREGADIVKGALDRNYAIRQAVNLVCETAQTLPDKYGNRAVFIDGQTFTLLKGGHLG